MKTYHKPGTMQYRLADISEKENLSHYGWVLVEEDTKRKKTAQEQPAAKEVDLDTDKGE